MEEEYVCKLNIYERKKPQFLCIVKRALCKQQYLNLRQTENVRRAKENKINNNNNNNNTYEKCTIVRACDSMDYWKWYCTSSYTSCVPYEATNDTTQTPSPCRSYYFVFTSFSILWALFVVVVVNWSNISVLIRSPNIHSLTLFLSHSHSHSFSLTLSFSFSHT